MLEAFGKGASEDIESAKDLIYTAMTYDPEQPTGVSPLSLTPPASPHGVGGWAGFMSCLCLGCGFRVPHSLGVKCM